MNNTNRILRDFLYLDVDRLYSLSSQMFEGVASHIVESFRSEQTRTEAQQSAKTWSKLGESLDEKVAEATLRTENKVVHDHLYNQLEKSLGAIIYEAHDVNAENFREELKGSFLIKVRGQAVIDDYGRLSTFLEKFNDLGISIALISTYKTGQFATARAELETRKNELRAKLQVCKNPLEKSQIKSHLEVIEHLEQPLEFLRAFAADMNLQQDPMFVAGLGTILEMFRSNTYEISVTLPKQDVPVSFRGVVDKQWLRAEPDYLRSLYGGSKIPTELVMVGQLTYIPAAKSDGLTAIAEVIPDETEDEQSMKDVSHSMFRIMDNLDEMMTASKQRIEMLVRPLAIYQEIVVPAQSDNP